MAIRTLKKHAVLSGVVTVEEAETLLQWLRAQARPAVHLGACEHVHGAVLQVLLAIRPRLVAPPTCPWLAAALGVAPQGA
jgi:hypothetical protein